MLSARTFGRGWLAVEVLGNEERLDPFADVDEAAGVQAARRARRLTALDEGRAWRQRSVGSLAVLRAECFADGDETEHRSVWRQDGPALVTALWRARWRERDRRPGWIEARLLDGDDRPGTEDAAAEDVDWLRVEDHTDLTGSGVVTCYEHLTIWAGRGHAVLVVRHDLGHDLDGTCLAAGRAIAAGLTR